MKNSGFRSAALAASAIILAAAQAGAVSLTVGTATTNVGENASIPVTLQTMGEDVAGTQNDLVYPVGEGVSIGVVATAQGRPTCAVNPEIGKEGTAFSFQPPNCNATGTCTGVRALVLSLSNVDPIPDGSTLYNCEFSVSSDTPANTYELTTTGVGASDPDGVALPATGVAGELIVEDNTPAPVVIEVGDANGPPDGNASVTVSLSADPGVDVAGTQNDIGFDPNAAIRAGSNGRPLCAVNAAIMKEGTAFSFQPPQCTVGTTCTAIRALVLSLSNVDPIPSGSALYSCDIATGAAGEYHLTCTGAGSSDPDGVALDTDCTDGDVVVGGEVPTETPTGPIEIPTNTPTPTSEGPTRTATRTPPTVVPPINDCDDGCAITAPAQSDNSVLVWLLPAAALLWLRRRAR